MDALSPLDLQVVRGAIGDASSSSQSDLKTIDDVVEEEEEEETEGAAAEGRGAQGTAPANSDDRTKSFQIAHNIPILPHLPKYSIIVKKQPNELLGMTASTKP